jgi:nucleoside-diphosphate-sugar epimerase
VHNGYFADYFVGPRIPTEFDRNLFPGIDTQNNIAAIPGSGDVHAVFTHTADVAKFAVALLESEDKWEKESNIVGQRITLNELVKKLEHVKGEKFSVTYDPVDKLEKGEITELPCHKEAYGYFPKEALQGMFSSFGLMFERGVFEVDMERTLNKKFPEVHARSVDELIAEGWGARSDRS